MFRLAIACVLSMCSPPPEDEPEPDPPVVAQSAQQPEPPPALPPQVAQPAEQPADQPPAQLPIAAPQLTGTYALTWRQDSADAPRIEEPEAVRDNATCIWGRWGWDFRNETIAIATETLCAATDQTEGSGFGACKAELVSNVRWHRGGFSIPAPVAAQSQLTVLRPRDGQPSSFRRGAVRCDVSVGALNASLTDVVAGDAPNRPREVTLLLSDGVRYHLEAVEASPDYQAIINERMPPPE